MVRIPLDFAATTEYAHACYGNARLPTGQAYSSYADELLTTTDKLWQRQFRHVDFIMPRWQEMIEAGRHVCRMFALMSRFGRTYEEINDVTNVTVADMLSAVSPDPRLPLPRRDLDLRSRVAAGGLGAQLICLADISLTTTSQTDWIRGLVGDNRVQREQLEEAVRVVSGQTIAMRGLLDSMHDVPRRGYVRQWMSEIDAHLGGMDTYLKRSLSTRPHLATARNGNDGVVKKKRVPKCPQPTLRPKISSDTSLLNTASTEKKPAAN